MNPVVCTLFEKAHHFGVAALANSLYKNSYRGVIYAGYKGELPFWSKMAVEDPMFSWKGSTKLEIKSDLIIKFLPIKTSYHLAHYKPDFMLTLMNAIGEEVDGIVYFDPDIVISTKWSFFCRWISYGVAMVHEIVSNDMPPTHPTRMEWQKVIKKLNKNTNREIHAYINCGFCGVSKKNLEFLEVWAQVIGEAISNYNMNPKQFATFDRTSTFWSIDQDAFNIAAMCCDSPISEMGPEAMDFCNAGWTMSHATGTPKPWEKNYLLAALDGTPPTKADKAYWLNTSGIINVYNPVHFKWKYISILLASLVGRFYRRH